MSFVCVKCAKEGKDALVRFASDRYVIEVAAKRNDGQDRAAQVSTHRLCKGHAEDYIEVIRRQWGRGDGPSPGQFGGQEALL